jgi:hypothetical protein
VLRFPSLPSADRFAAFLEDEARRDAKARELGGDACRNGSEKQPGRLPHAPRHRALGGGRWRGRHGGGEIASAAVAEALRALPSGLPAGELLGQVRAALNETNAALRAEAKARGPRALLASTVVALLIRDGHFACLWAGDSRCYLCAAACSHR